MTSNRFIKVNEPFLFATEDQHRVSTFRDYWLKKWEEGADGFVGKAVRGNGFKRMESPRFCEIRGKNKKPSGKN